MRDEIRALLEIQELDMEIRELQDRSREISGELEALRGEIEKDERIIREEKEKEMSSRVRSKELELEVEDKKNRIDKYQSQLFKIKNNKEYTALIHEIEGLKADIRVTEDRILEFMEEGEGEKSRMEEAEADLERIRARFLQREEEVREELASLESRIEARRREREAKAESVDPDIRERYEIIFARKPDRAVAAVYHGACTGCNMELTAQVETDLAREEMVCQCENCGRFIYLPAGGD